MTFKAILTMYAWQMTILWLLLLCCISLC